MVTLLGTPVEPNQSGQWAPKAPRPNGPVTSSVTMKLIFSFQLPTRLNWQATHSRLLLQPRCICSLIRTRQSEHKHSVVRMKGLLFSVWHILRLAQTTRLVRTDQTVQKHQEASWASGAVSSQEYEEAGGPSHTKLWLLSLHNRWILLVFSGMFATLHSALGFGAWMVLSRAPVLWQPVFKCDQINSYNKKKLC